MKHVVLLILWLVCLLGAVGASIAKEAQPNEDPKIEQRMRAAAHQANALVSVFTSQTAKALPGNAGLRFGH